MNSLAYLQEAGHSFFECFY